MSFLEGLFGSKDANSAGLSAKNVTASAFAAATVVDVAYAQHASYWQRIGNMQSSAGAVLTVIAIVASLLVAISSQVDVLDDLTARLDAPLYSFAVSFCLAFIYLFISAFFAFKVISPKTVNVLTNPLSLYEMVDSEVAGQIDESMSAEQISIAVHFNVLLKLNEELVSIESILTLNQRAYGRCLLAAFWSFTCSFIALLHVALGNFLNIQFASVMLCLLGYFCVLGLIHLLVSVQKP